jgi:hypothetical protein
MMFSWQRLLLCNIPREGGGDNQGSSVGEATNDTAATTSPADPSPPDATPPDADPDAPSPNAKETAFLGGALNFGAPSVMGSTPNPGSNVANALGRTDFAGFGTNMSGFTTDMAATTTSPFGGATNPSNAVSGSFGFDANKADPSSIPGYEGYGSNVGLSTLGQSFTSPTPDTQVDAKNTTNPNNSTTNPNNSTTANPNNGTTTIGSTTGPTTSTNPNNPSTDTTTEPTTGTDPIVSNLVNNFISGLVNVTTPTNAVSNILGSSSSKTSTQGSSTSDLGPSGSGGITDIPVKPTATTLASYDLTNDKG